MVEIKGQVVDRDTLRGLEETPIYVDKIIEGVTDDDGEFIIDVAAGKHLFEVRPREFIPYIKQVMIVGENDTSNKGMYNASTDSKIPKTIHLTRATL